MNNFIKSKKRMDKILNSIKHTLGFQDLTCSGRFWGINTLIRRSVKIGCRQPRNMAMNMKLPVAESKEILMYVIGAILRAISRKSDSGVELTKKLCTTKGKSLKN